MKAQQDLKCYCTPHQWMDALEAPPSQRSPVNVLSTVRRRTKRKDASHDDHSHSHLGQKVVLLPLP